MIDTLFDLGVHHTWAEPSAATYNDRIGSLFKEDIGDEPDKHTGAATAATATNTVTPTSLPR